MKLARILAAAAALLVGVAATTAIAGPAHATAVADGALDTGFNHGGFDGFVISLVAQPDGRVIAGGFFTAFDAWDSNVTVNHVARLNTDGTLDTTFNHGGFNGPVRSIVVQPDSKIVVAGDFTAFDPAGTPITVNRIARLNTDGTLDTTFNHGGFNNKLFSVAVQPDGKIITGGEFSTFDPAGTPITVNRIARLNTDGTLDTTFNHGGFDSAVYTVAVQPDGKIITGGEFSTFDPAGTPITVNRIARLNTDGTLDTTFNHSGFDSAVYSVAVQPDGKIITGGGFTAFDPAGTPITVNQIARLNTDGTLDTTFNHGGFSSAVYTVAVQSNGKIITGGGFTAFDPAGTPITVLHIARLNTDGTLDTGFNHGGFNGPVASVAVQPDGKIVAGGAISIFDPLGSNLAVTNIARLGGTASLPSTGTNPTLLLMTALGLLAAGSLLLTANRRRRNRERAYLGNVATKTSQSLLIP